MPNKWQDAKPAEKLLTLYTTLLVSPKALSLGDLAEMLGCSKQTVGRLVDQLESSKFGTVISSKQGRELFYELDRPKRAPNVCINAEGLTQMALCMDFLQRILPPKMVKVMHRAWLNAANLASEEDEQGPVLGLGASLSKGHIDYEPFEGIFRTLIKAIASERACRITYRSHRRSEPKSWDFAPKRLLSYRECIYVAGYPLSPRDGENKPLQLPLQRFVSCEILARSSKKIPDPPIDGDKLGIMAGDPFEIAVRFEAAAATYAAERQWSAGQRQEDLEDGSIVLHIRSQSPEECISWILGFGPNATLLSPPWLKDLLRERVRAMHSLYF